MNLRHLDYFLAVMETGSVSRAAEALGITQPTLSQALKRLEAEFDAPLFEAAGRGLRPRPAARALEAHARPALRALAAAKQELKGPRPSAVRLGLLASLGPTWLSPILRVLGDRLDLVETDEAGLQEALRRNRIDLALTVLPAKTDLPHRPVMREPFQLIVGAGHPLAARRTVALADLAGHDFVQRLACERLGTGRRLVEAAGLRLRVVARTRQEATAAALIGQGVGCTIAARSWAGPGLIAVPIRDFALSRDLGLIWRDARHRPLALDLARHLPPPFGQDK